MSARTRRTMRIVGATLYAALVVVIAAAIASWLYRVLWLPQPEILELTVRGHEVKLLEPRALWLLLAAPVVLSLQWFNLTDFHWFQRILNVLLRLALLAALVAALARPSVSRFDSKLCTVYLVDVSASVPDEVLVQARDIVQAGQASRGTHQVSLVTFAARPQVVPMPPGAGEVAPIRRHAGEDAGLASDPSAALRLSYGLCPQDHIKRAVLITDGNQNRGNLAAEAATAAEFGVRLYTWEIPFEPAPEIMVRDLELPDDVRLSEPFTMIADIYSNRDTTARLDLTQNEFRDIRGQQVELIRGVNRIELTAEVYEPGFRRFTLEVRPEGEDRFEDNNTYVRTVTVEGRPRVLYVEGESRSRTYLSRALDRERNDLANFDLEVRDQHGFPNSVEEMANFDLIILSDVHANDISRSAMSAVRTWVRELGGGFIMVGGERSFGPGGWDNTPLEEISPVTFDMERQRDMPSLAIMLVIDRSGSMAYGGEGRPTKAEHAATLLGALALILVRQGDAAGLSVIDQAVQKRLPPRTRPAHLEEVLVELARPPERGTPTNLHDALTEVAERARRRGLVAIASDLLDFDEAALAPLSHLIGRGHDVVVFQVLDPDEIELPFDDAARFEGLEGEASLDADPATLREAYRAEVDHFIDACRRRCSAVGARWVLARTDEPAERTLASVLTRGRGKGWG
ncbi:MAG: VWA domain-containing protein [Myxococcales bacterium]|nr:VWA domain-containing protein [Myxococcales bacterium]